IFVKEFYAKMIVIHLKKKDVVKSKVRGVEMEFDHEKLATILSVHGTNGICEYIKDVWEESRIHKNVVPGFGKRDTSKLLGSRIHGPLDVREKDWLTMVFEAFGVPLVNKKGEEPKRYDFFEDTFLTMCKLTGDNGIWWIGSRENRRRDDDVDAPEEEAEEEEERNRGDFDWEASGR
ncbi:hypothetical protein Dimus_022024, partial [Dionaea muscipula]